MPIPIVIPRLVVTAGPTHEPIDAVRHLANRSSGKLGVSIAEAASQRGWDVTLLLGPVDSSLDYTHGNVERFTTTSDLERLLHHHAPLCEVLIMAAAVADYRLRHPDTSEKLQRKSGSITLKLEATPDLLADVAARRLPGQLIVGFALEPANRLLSSAEEKLRRKKVDAIVANPIQTIARDTIEATIIWRSGSSEQTPGELTKMKFAHWLLDRIEAALKQSLEIPPDQLR